MVLFRIVCHNAFWFQGYPFRDEIPPDPDTGVLDSLCRIYRSIEPDVICLQEVQGRHAFEMICGRLGMSGSYCPGSELTQYGGAMLWHNGRGDAVSDSSSSGAEVQRVFQIAEFTGPDIQLRICNIHLPSQRQLGPRLAAERRIRDLVEAVKLEPDLVVGDFNEPPGRSVGKRLERMGFVDSAGVLGHGNVSTSLGGGRGDFIWVREELSGCLREYGVIGKKELDSRGSMYRYLSDHLPLWISLSEGCRT